MHTRMYLLLALCIWVFAGDAASAQAPFRLSPANKQYSVFTSNSELSYRINMSGALDEFNTSNYRANYGAHRAIFSGFQPNKYLMIENQGTTNVTNPQITVNGRRNWNSAESIVASVASPTMTQAEKAMAIFNHVSAYDTSCHDNNRRVGPELPENPKDLKQGQFKELADPVKAANAYYCSGCSLLSSNMVLLAQKAGIQGRVVWVSPSETYRNHAVAELYYDNDWHVFDPDRRAFYLEKDNKTIASYKDLHERPELVARTHLGGFASKGVGPSLAREFGMYGSPKEMPVDPSWSSNMNMTLRPGERFLWRWDSDDKYRVGNNPRNPGLSPPQLANGKIIYQPRLEPSLRASSEVSEANLNTAVGAQGAIRLTPKAVGVDSQLTYRVDSPYPIVGGLIGARVQRSSLENAAQLQISRDGTTWVSAWSASHIGETQAYASIDGLLNAKHSEPIYSYYVRFTGKQSHLNSTLSISDLYVETDVQMARTSLPSLSVGLNEIVYKDQTKAKTGSKVKISHGWQESWATLPPNAPATSVSPAVGETVTSAGQLYLNWQAASDPRGDSIVGYHVQVSDRQDMMYALSPSLDRMTYNSSTSWQIPDGWLTPGQRYYWHVRALDSWGAWSPWSSTWHFQVSTPPASRPVAALAIPEPSTGLLLLVGLVGSAQMFRRQTISN